MPVRAKANANYGNGRIVWRQTRRDGYDAPIILSSRGKVSEGPGMSLFIIRDGRLATPSISNDILESITRDTLLQVCREDLNLEVEERNIDRSELYAADEAFFCGTAWEIVPITSIDRLPVGCGHIGPITDRITRYYKDLVRGLTGTTLEKDWWTRIYRDAPAGEEGPS